MTNEEKPETKSDSELDEASLEKVSGGAAAAGSAGETVATNATTRRRSGDDDLEDLEVER